MKTRWTSGLLLLLVLLLARPGLAVNCQRWNRMGDGQRSASIDRMIRSTVSGSGGRQYHVDRGALARCLEGRARTIQYDFDGICDDPRYASMNALNTAFKNYVWSCAGAS